METVGRRKTVYSSAGNITNSPNTSHREKTITENTFGPEATFNENVVPDFQLCYGSFFFLFSVVIPVPGCFALLFFSHYISICLFDDSENFLPFCLLSLLSFSFSSSLLFFVLHFFSLLSNMKKNG